MIFSFLFELLYYRFYRKIFYIFFLTNFCNFDLGWSREGTMNAPLNSFFWGLHAVKITSDLNPLSPCIIALWFLIYLQLSALHCWGFLTLTHLTQCPLRCFPSGLFCIQSHLFDPPDKSSVLGLFFMSRHQLCEENIAWPLVVNTRISH